MTPLGLADFIWAVLALLISTCCVQFTERTVKIAQKAPCYRLHVEISVANADTENIL